MHESKLKIIALSCVFRDFFISHFEKRTLRNHEHKSFLLQMTTLTRWKYKRNFVDYMIFFNISLSN